MKCITVSISRTCESHRMRKSKGQGIEAKIRIISDLRQEDDASHQCQTVHFLIAPNLITGTPIYPVAKAET